MDSEDCPTCQLIATCGIFYDAECKIHDKEKDRRISGTKPENADKMGVWTIWKIH
ncbi:MAG: hypothetical protein ACE3JK_14120 [Sporolactobacillus sp.]